MPMKTSRPRKRGSSSSSSCGPTIITIFFIALCVGGVWFFSSSSSSVLSSPTSTTRGHAVSFPDRLSSRLSLTDPPPALEDTQGDLPENAVKSDDSSASSEEDDQSNNQQDQQQTSNEQTSEEEQNQTSIDQSTTEEEQNQTSNDQSTTEEEQNQTSSDQSTTEEEQNQTSNDQSTTEEERQQRDEQSNDNRLEEQRDEQNGEHEQEERRADKIAEKDRERAEEQNPSEDPKPENVDSNDEQNAETTIAEEAGHEANGGQVAVHPDIDVSVQKQIEEDDMENRGEDGGGGITSQSQIEHDTEGTPEEQQQEPQHHSEGENNESQQQNEDNPNGSDSLPEGSQAEMSSEKGKAWVTQADQSVDENARRKEDTSSSNGDGGEGILDGGEWQLCNVTAGADYIPCLDNEKAIKKLHSLKHFEHRERHCPEESPTCLVPLPEGYKRSIEWPQSRDRVIIKILMI